MHFNDTQLWFVRSPRKRCAAHISMHRDSASAKQNTRKEDECARGKQYFVTIFGNMLIAFNKYISHYSSILLVCAVRQTHSPLSHVFAPSRRRCEMRARRIVCLISELICCSQACAHPIWIVQLNLIFPFDFRSVGDALKHWPCAKYINWLGGLSSVSAPTNN